MAPRKKPTSVTIRSYQVGFGDCFLVSFNYGEDGKPPSRHVLIDFGSTSLPKQGGFSLESVAKDIKEQTAGKLTAVVATHRHRDHISGFGGNTGRLIADLHPDVVLQPWTEHPLAQPDATSPPAALAGAKGFVGALAAMHDVARFSLQEIAALRAPKTVKDQIAFLGEDNLANLDAVKTLMGMSGQHVYAYYGSKSGLEKVLPGVKVHVLGPPTLKQSRAIERQRDEDKDEFWHLQAKASRRAASAGKPLFPRAARVTGSVLPVETRWFLPRVEAVRGDQLLEIVRILDMQMNNTSVILLFEVGTKKLLFPGDAQLENWMYAMKEAKEASAVRKLLSDVDVYKVGHHGSLNATPKTLWNLFRKKNTDEQGKGRLQTIVSTMTGKHGSVDRGTEVPRSKLVQALKTESTFATTQSLTNRSVPYLRLEIPV
jgi:ribonuclease BN (tRNA processing enzyme)